MVVYIHRDKNLLAYMGSGKKRRLIRILTITSTGAVIQYEPLDEPGVIYSSLIENGQNVEEVEILGEQLSLF